MTTSNRKIHIPCDIYKVWETVLAVEDYHIWQRNVSRTEVVNENQFIVYTRDGYTTRFTVTMAEPCRRWELDVENSHIKGHWTFVFTPKGGETEIDVTSSATAKQLFMRPVGKSVFEKMYLKKEQTQFVTDLKNVLDYD